MFEPSLEDAAETSGATTAAFPLTMFRGSEERKAHEDGPRPWPLRTEGCPPSRGARMPGHSEDAGTQ